MTGRREWTEEELRIARSLPAKWPRTNKLSPEQVIELRRRIDSISTPWTLRDLAHEYGLTVTQIINIARRKQWNELAHEPDNARWWWLEEQERRRREG